ncbi:hypothetical protein HAX54_038963 [Datura stramonium]|uniref:Uncharacterized protein n=1 Tax=Datura stramonium TaxID=4076 RepID=A0ABS8VKH6_DATST|nr:hypothetical protein [Datura stramonium]
MAQILLQGTLHVTIFEVDRLHTNLGRDIFNKVVQGIEGAIGFNKTNFSRSNSLEELLATINSLDGEVVDEWLEILNTERNLRHGHSKIHVKLRIFDVTRECNWNRGIKVTRFPGVPYTFLSQRQGCKGYTYQDTHVPFDNFLPKIPLAGGKFYEPQRCREDIFDAIKECKHI